MIKKITYFFWLLFILTAVRTFAQDYPHSVGPAPVIYNQSAVPEVFTNANPNSRALVFIASGSITNQVLFKHLLLSCTGPQVGVAQTYFPGAMARVTPNRHYILDQIAIRLLRTDTLGNFTLLGSITGTPMANLTGMTWDATTGQMFVVATSLTASRLGRLDTATRVITPIGDSSAVCRGAISISCSPTGTLFVISIVDDNLYRVNKTSGVFSLIGPVTPCNFGQDAHFDSDGILYWAAYTTGPQLRVVDTTNGSSVQVCSYVGTQATAITTIPYVPPGVNFCRNGLNIVIPALGSALPDSVFISIPGAIIQDVNVRIDTVIHTFDGDLKFYLRRAVGNVGVRIINQVGGGGDNFIGTILDDEATTPVPAGTAPFTGSFIPSSPLTPFDGPFNSGYWVLQIVDTVGGDSGFLRAWCISLTYVIVNGGIETLEIPNTYRLYQNYPNPFNPSTKIKFGLPKNSNVKLTIYDVLGREVAILINELKTANTYEVDFDGSALPSGVYFYKLESEDFAVTKKMLLIK